MIRLSNKQITIYECSFRNSSLAEEFCAREASQILGGRSYLRGNHIGGRIERCYREVPVGAEVFEGSGWDGVMGCQWEIKQGKPVV